MIPAKLQEQFTNNPLTYRQRLTIPESIHFGVEIEVENIRYNEFYTLIIKQFGTNWKVKKDDSLDPTSGAEIASPILINKKETWLLLKKLGELLSRLRASYADCSFQINFDGKLLPTDEDKIRFLKLYAMYEDIIYRFSKGEDNTYRQCIDMYASPISLFLKDQLKLKNKALILAAFTNNKRYGIIFKKGAKNLIEFRTPNGTSNPILWQNYITTFYYLLKNFNNPRFDKTTIDEYIENFTTIDMLSEYEKENLSKATNFANIIFKKQTDQLYFLQQYLSLRRN